MAEARMGVRPVPALGVDQLKVDTANQHLQVAVSKDGVLLFIPSPVNIVRNTIRAAAGLLHSTRHALWPLPPGMVGCAVLAFTGYTLRQDSEKSQLRNGWVANKLWSLDTYGLRLLGMEGTMSIQTRVAYLSTIAATVPIWVCTLAHRGLLSLILRYNGWLDEPSNPKHMSLVSKCWWVAVKLLTKISAKPVTSTFQGVLPPLPVPKLESTVSQYLTTMQPLKSAEDFDQLTREAQSFLCKEGRTLQFYVWLRSFFVPNYVSDWWLRFVYLRQRESIFINSNFYGISTLKHVPSNRQVARAASLVYQLTKIALEIEKETLPPMQFNGVPFCMAQYNHAFSSCREPGREEDKLVSYQGRQSRHIVVLYKGAYYKLSILDRKKKILQAYDIQQLLLGIVQAEKHRPQPSSTERALSSLTTLPRTEWAEFRELQFSDGLNKASIETIEKALFVLHLDDSAPTDLTDMAKRFMTGDTGDTRWCDKSATAIVLENGVWGVCIEHSWGDAPIFAQFVEMIFMREARYPETYDQDGYITKPDRHNSQGTPAQRLHWYITSEVENKVTKAIKAAKESIHEFQLKVIEFDEWGKGVVKKLKMSPDAFIQMALQLAYYRDQGDIVLTYEAAMMRFYKDGRTETVRSCSNESKAFVLTAMDESSSSTRIDESLVDAISNHSRYAKEAVAGRAIDRHLFALFVAAKGSGVESPFLQEAISQPWKLSTSQVPQRQLAEEWKGLDDKNEFYYSPSGGFAPVADDGYGVSYAVAGEGRFFFHVSAKTSCPTTDAARMAGHIAQALRDMKRWCFESRGISD